MDLTPNLIPGSSCIFCFHTHTPSQLRFFVTCADNLLKIHDLPQFRVFPISDKDLSIVPHAQWASGMGWMPWAYHQISIGTLVMLQQSGVYTGSLGIVITTSIEHGEESLIIAVVPRISYPLTTVQSRTDSPRLSHSCKHQKLNCSVHPEHQTDPQASTHQDSLAPQHSSPNSAASRKLFSSKPPAQLFDVAHHLCYIGPHPNLIKHNNCHEDGSPQNLYAFFAWHGGAFALKLLFPSKDFSTHNKYGELTDKDGHIFTETLYINCNNLSWIHVSWDGNPPVVPVYKFKGCFYWCGLRLVPTYCYCSMDCTRIIISQEELIPFIKSDLFPKIFDHAFIGRKVTGS